MKVICLNGWGGKMHRALVEYVSHANPDVLCLQEVVHSPDTVLEWLTYRDGVHVLPQRANFLADVCAALPDHNATFCPAAIGTLWDNDTPVASQWGLATFVRKSLPVIGQVQGFVHKEFSAAGFGDHPRSRAAHAVRLWHGATGGAVTITQMHGLRDLAGKLDTPARAVQMRRLLAMSDAVSQADDHRIICGDFNVMPDSETLTFLGNSGFTELVTAGGFSGTRNSQYTKPARFADYMLTNQPHAVRDFDVVFDPEVSDHCPLVLEI